MLIRSALAVFLVSTCTWATPPTDEQIDALIKTVAENRTKMMEVQMKLRTTQQAPKEGDNTQAAKPDTKALQDEIKELTQSSKAAAEKVDLGEASLPQIEKLVTAQVASMAEVRKVLAAPLTEMSKAATVDGARAAELRVQCFPLGTTAEERAARDGELAQAYAAALKHPSLAALLKSGKGDTLIRQMGSFKPEIIKANNLTADFEPVLDADLSLVAAGALAGTVDKVRDATDTGDRDRILDKIAAAAERSVKNAPEDALPASVKRATDTAKLARSGWARGTMIGNTAPEITFQWSNASHTKLSDLKGKVVLLDFWATWCGPCVASFPKIRELQARYKDYPVVILGVTSIQGRHIDQTVKPAKTIDCKDDPAKEMGLMPEFIKGMDMTWSVAFSEDGCFNPNYGVRGIPHLAIIDPEGRVRFNELRPKDPADDAEKIDALLKEFKLQCPETPMAKTPVKAASGS